MKTLHWPDLSVVVQIEKDIACINFKVFDVVGHGMDDNRDFTVNLYEKTGATSSEDTTEDLKEAQTLIHGTIKWDACSHVYFGSNGYIHMCGVESWRNIPAVMTRLFQEAKAILVEPHSADIWE